MAKAAPRATHSAQCPQPIAQRSSRSCDRSDRGARSFQLCRPAQGANRTVKPGSRHRHGQSGCATKSVEFQLPEAQRYRPFMANRLLDRITVEPGKCGGRPCIRGKRIRVTDVLELLANEASIEEIVADHPGLEREDVLAAIAYAAHQTDHAVIREA
jgi:uncharacterized protein (DUF433 family)